MLFWIIHNPELFLHKKTLKKTIAIISTIIYNFSVDKRCVPNKFKTQFLFLIFSATAQVFVRFLCMRFSSTYNISSICINEYLVFIYFDLSLFFQIIFFYSTVYLNANIWFCYIFQFDISVTCELLEKLSYQLYI